MSLSVIQNLDILWTKNIWWQGRFLYELGLLTFMIRRIVYWAYCIVAVHLVACSSANREINDVETFDVISNLDDVDWNRFLKVTDVTPLAAGDSVYLSPARKVIVSENMIFYADWKSKLVYGMSKEGHVIREYGSVGYAKNEYVELRDMALSHDGKYLEILDANKLLRYDIKSGDFVSSIKMPKNDIWCALPCDEGHHLIYSPHPVDGHSVMLLGDVDENASALRDNAWFSLSLSSLVKGERRILVLPHYGEYTIDCYENGKLSPLYKLNMGDKALPAGTRPQSITDFQEADKQTGLFRSLTQVAENEEWLYAEMVGPGDKYYIVFINKVDKRVVSGKRDRTFPVMIAGMSGDKIYGILYPEFVADMYGYAPELTQYVDTDNPLLLTMSICY